MKEMYVKSNEDLEITKEDFVHSVKKGKKYKVEKYKESLFIRTENEWILIIGSIKEGGEIEINRMFRNRIVYKEVE